MTEYCAVIGTHFMVWGGKLLYVHIPWYGMGSGHIATKMSSIHVGHVVFHHMLLCCCQQARTICFHCADKVYRYQLTLKAVVFTIILMECVTLVNEMLLMISGDIHPNPGPGECLDHTVSPKLTHYLFSCIYTTLRKHARFMTLHVTILCSIYEFYNVVHRC